MSKEQKIKSFDPNSPGDPDANIYGLPFTCEEADTVIVPVPWDVTVSYADGTANGPEAVFNASFQVDLYEPDLADAWKSGIAMDEIPLKLKARAEDLRSMAVQYIDALTNGEDVESDPELQKILLTVNEGSAELNAWVKNRCLHWLQKGKRVGLLGGDHSTPFGMLQAQAELHEEFGILQIDAHADLRVAYEGFTYSHASIMYNALSIPQVKRLVQVGIRDFCQQEKEIIDNSKGRVITFFDRDMRHEKYKGVTWHEITKRIIASLPQKVYISFDIDGLEPGLCPHTGTPVAGGLEFEQAGYLFTELVKSGKQIIGFDLNEVAPGPDGDEWDANVGARMLYRMCNIMTMAATRK
ncbi:MAG: agmatinase family protein [Bacteroidia bacterium]|nr:agmatinase family protein [Bacteroidia bacterium]